MPQYSGMWTLSQVSQAVKNQTWTGLPPSVVEYLVVAGGGGGTTYGGGGGAGGLLAGHAGITSGSSYFVTVGGGGAGVNTSANGTNGNNSVLVATTSGASTGNIVASGGGGGGYSQVTGNSGGCGGGGGGGTLGAVGGAGVSGQGNAGGMPKVAGGQYATGGGGGAGTIGLDTVSGSIAANGGAGVASAISGTVTTYAGGGAGSVRTNGTASFGGVGGGANGVTGNLAGINGTVNTGGGASSAGESLTGGTGGSGIVIIRYPGTTQFFTGGTLSYANGYIIHTFYANGTLVPIAGTLYANPDYQISRSLRFNQNDAAYLNRTFSVAGNRKTWTQSLWVKRSSLGTQQDLYSPYYGGDGVNESQAHFNSSGQLVIYDSGGEAGYFAYITTQLFRDFSAWYHIVFACDTTQTTASDRMKIYVNGVQITSFTTSQTQTQNTNTGWNDAQLHRIGSYARNTTATLDGYMAEFHNIDGQALTPSSFGWTNPATGVWAPLDYVGSYGTNGFHLNFSDNSNVTAATLGADSSGNGHNWTPNNFSVTAGIGNDSLVDSPTLYGTDTGVGGEVRGNYSTWSPLANLGLTLTNGNLTNYYATAFWTGTTGTMAMASGTWYFEYTVDTTASYTQIGVIETGRPLPTGGLQLQNGTAYAWTYQTYGQLGNNSAYITSGITSATGGDIIMIAVDVSNGKIWFGKNGTWFNSGSPSTGTNAAYTNLSGSMIPAIYSYGTEIGNTNFGQRAFAYTAPSGFKALNTQNLPTPTIGATSATLANKFFNTVTYTATPGTGGTVSVGFQPDLLWVKNRDNVENHYWQDSVRGFSPSTGVTKMLKSNSTAGEASETGITCTTTSDGFTVVDSVPASGEFWFTNRTYVAWNWKAGGTAVTNTSGSITSSVSASTTAGFSIVSFNSTSATGTATIGHGLGAVPSMIIMKNRAYYNWEIYHISSTSTSGRLLFTVSAKLTDSNPWNQSAQPVTSSIFGYDQTWNNGSNDNIIAYCFAPIAGYSAFGSYTGNGSADGTFVHTGFRPAFVMVKASSTTSSWIIFDTARDTYNVAGYEIYPNSANAETYYADLDILSNGFKHRQSGSPNASGVTYIYACFAQNPFKYSLAR